MSDTNMMYAFCADYGAQATCLFSIQKKQAAGDFQNYPEVIVALDLLENDLLKKLFSRVLKVFSGLPNQGTSVGQAGDFKELDFSSLDFITGYLNTTNDSYSARFQTVLNLLAAICKASPQVSDDDKKSIDTVLIPFIDGLNALLDLLTANDLSACTSVNSYFNNSPQLYLQSAGSDGSDGTASGIHLRWSLIGELGNNHLPQGKYVSNASEPNGFNTPNDFITLQRAPYVNPVSCAIDFSAASPTINFSSRTWTFPVSTSSGTSTFNSLVRMVFEDTAAYDALAVEEDPLLNSPLFLKNYTGIIAISVSNKAAFSVTFNYQSETANLAGDLKIEVLSASDNNDASGETQTVREIIHAAPLTSVVKTILADNIRTVRIKKTPGTILSSFSFETYHDFIKSRAEDVWTTVGQFALSLDTTEVYQRLEDKDNYPVDHLWPCFNGGDTVRVANYQDKWDNDNPVDFTIKDAVGSYLLASQTDPRAIGQVKDTDPATAAAFEISYLDALNMMAQDYHIARMLGLGSIDPLAKTSPSVSFIYRVTYVNKKSLSSSAPSTLMYLGIPTSKQHFRLPETPVMRPLVYGLPAGSEFSTEIFDSKGYSKSTDVRAIEIGRKVFDYETTDEVFFSSPNPDTFNLFKYTKPVLYGIEYRPDTQTTYVEPELTAGLFSGGTVYLAYNDKYPDTGVIENIPVPDSLNSLFVHLEKNPGIHHYAIYGINWFSRASATSSEQSTDETMFPIRNNLSAPTDITVQYIQQETELLFTSAQEQAWLKGRRESFPAADTEFTRVTYNWLDIVDISYLPDVTSVPDLTKILEPDKTCFYFRNNAPLQVAGIITSTSSLSFNTNQLLLQIGGYTLIDGTLVDPVINQTDYQRFTNSLLVTPGGQYKVVGISGTPTTVMIEMTENYGAAENPLQKGAYTTVKSFSFPEPGDRFTITENLSDAANWQKLNAEVQLFSQRSTTPPVTEIRTDEEGNKYRYLVGGISCGALVEQLHDQDSNPIAGYYKVTFPTGTVLQDHPQGNVPFDNDHPQNNNPGTLQLPYVQWYNGLIRLPTADASADKKLLQVVSIAQRSPLVLYVADPTYTDAPVLLSVSSTDLIPLVNYHPGYKVYLFAEPGPAAKFNSGNIHPLPNQNTRKSFLGLQMASTSSGLASPVSLPGVLMASTITEPVKPETPKALSLKVRPGADRMAAFTFDTEIKPDSAGYARSPFGFMFYRTNHEDVLKALYQPATVSDIMASLALLTEDVYYNERILELVNLVLDSTGNFKVFDALPQPYGFPLPDLVSLTNTGDSADVKLVKYRLAVWRTLLPLTEQIPVLAYVNSGTSTENKTPVIRSDDGALLTPLSSGFNPFPMIRKFVKPLDTTTTIVRFTDYNLSGSSRRLYFYASAEVTNKLVPGDLSAFTGPVVIVNSLPAAAPLLLSYQINTGSRVTGDALITFKMAPFPASDPMSKIRIYRDSNPLTASLAGMKSYLETAVDTDADGMITVDDTFADIATIPFGETMYFRLAFVRTIINEKDVSEDIVSLGSAPVAIKLIDTENPAAPLLAYDSSTKKLTWTATANLSLFSVMLQNQRGNWQSVWTSPAATAGQAMEYNLPNDLLFQDSDGNRIYSRFKVNVQNSSGLQNLSTSEITI
jgi:hypothetical protein